MATYPSLLLPGRSVILFPPPCIRASLSDLLTKKMWQRVMFWGFHGKVRSAEALQLPSGPLGTFSLGVPICTWVLCWCSGQPPSWAKLSSHPTTPPDKGWSHLDPPDQPICPLTTTKWPELMGVVQKNWSAESDLNFWPTKSWDIIKPILNFIKLIL